MHGAVLAYPSPQARSVTSLLSPQLERERLQPLLICPYAPRPFSAAAVVLASVDAVQLLVTVATHAPATQATVHDLFLLCQHLPVLIVWHLLRGRLL